jgi:hypothetical protein
MDLTPISAPLTKLIEVVAKGIGVVYEPIHAVRMAKAHAKAELILADADDKILDIKQRAAKRVVYTEITRQENIESILDIAAAELPPAVQAESVDQDWSRQFFIGAQDVSEKEIQQLWARILVGEVSHPGQFSKRTIEALKVFDRKEAEMFAALLSVSFVSRNGSMFYFIANATESAMQSKLREDMDWQRHLVDIGILAAETRVLMSTQAKSVEYAFGEQHFVLDGPPAELVDKLFPSSHWIESRSFTFVGQQLSRVVSTSRDSAFVEALNAEFTDRYRVSFRAK